MAFLAGVKPSIPVHVRYNMDSTLDLATGRPQVGQKGETIINGGITPYTALVGAPKTFKSVLGDSIVAIMSTRYGVETLKHNSEPGGDLFRIQEISKHCAPDLYNNPDIESFDKIVVTGLDQYTGSEIWDLIGKIAAEREKAAKKLVVQTPLMDKDGIVCTIPPFLWFEDSLSVWRPDNVIEMQDKNEAGSKGQNMVFMSGGRAKTQMIAEYPTMIARSGMFFVQTAHLGEKYQLDAYAPKFDKLAFAKTNIVIKQTCDMFHYLPSTMWWVMGVRPLLHPKNKTPEYQRDETDTKVNDTDLMLMVMTNVRGTTGSSGFYEEIVMSQTEGWIPRLSEFRYIKEWGTGDVVGFGMHGNNVNFRLDLLPEVCVTRNTVRTKLAQDPKFAQATRFTADLCFIHERMKRYPKEMLCTAQELYEDLKKLGYDWDRLLNTRSYWTFDQYTHPIPFLTIFDLLRMRAGLYRPYWYD